VTLGLEGEPSWLKARGRKPAPGFAAFEIGDEADALGMEKPKGIRRKAAAVED